MIPWYQLAFMSGDAMCYFIHHISRFWLALENEQGTANFL